MSQYLHLRGFTGRPAALKDLIARTESIRRFSRRSLEFLR
jgi:hypothetical protein